MANPDPRGTIPLGFPSPLASGQLSTRPGKLMGWSVRETSNVNAAVFRLWDGQAAGAQLLAPFSLKAGESTRDWLGPQGINVANAMFLEVVSGAFEGVAWYQVDLGV